MKVRLTEIHNHGFKFDTEFETLEELATHISEQKMFFRFETKSGNDIIQHAIAVDHIVSLTVLPEDQSEAWKKREGRKLIF